MSRDEAGLAYERLADTKRPIEAMRFVVVGAYVADCFVSTPRLPAWGDVYQAQSIRTSAGGKALNQAVALARLGAQVTAVGVVGSDGLGRDVLATLAREAIDTSGMQTRENAPTSICLCFVDQGQTSFVGHVADEVAVAPDDLRAAGTAIQQADAVLLTFELPVPTIRETISTARRYGVRVFVQPAPPLADANAGASLPWGEVDVLVPNETEARALLDARRERGELPPEALVGALAAELAVPTVVVTLGASGCVIHNAGATYRYRARRAPAVDATGASDAFTATVTAYLTAGASLADALRAAQAAAAVAVSRPGGHESMPYHAELIASRHSD